MTIRFTPIITAGKSFTHIIACYKVEGHVLIKGGIYKYIRHPSYLGFLIFAPATQMILLNPITTILFVIVTWYFFYDRIPDEKESLLEIFGDEYKKVPPRYSNVDSIHQVKVIWPFFLATHLELKSV